MIPDTTSLTEGRPVTVPSLADHHRQLLHDRGVADTVIETRGYHSVETRPGLRALGFSPAQTWAAPALVIPRFHLNGATAPAQIRPDTPRVLNDKRSAKYETVAGCELGVDALPVSVAALRDGSEAWISVEGHIKADAMLSAGVPATLAVVGIWSWKTPRALLTWKAVVDSCPGRWITVVADNDFTTSSDVPVAVCRLGAHLHDLGARVRILHPPASDEKVGVDDLLGAGGDLDHLVQVRPDRVAEVLRHRPRGPRAYAMAHGNPSSGEDR